MLILLLLFFTITFLILLVFTRLSSLFVPSPTKPWEISPYPNGHRFAFTIIHDADDAYSERLAPLFRVFDKYGFKLSISVFAFWNKDEANKFLYKNTPSDRLFYEARAVPLEEKSEQDFYKKLASKGHEIGLHSASNLTDTREDTQRAFEYFRDVFGYYPKIYIEHRDADNKECVQNKGSHPESNYYIVDILNRYGPWVWIISPSALPYEGRGNYFNILDSSSLIFSDTALQYWGVLREFLKTGNFDLYNGELYLTMIKGGTPFDTYALKKYGIIKAFRRTGRAEQANGEGFLKWYSKDNIDKLEKEGGIALVYTHMNSKWLDMKAREMRVEIKERLKYIASKDVWLASAGEILQRFKDISNVYASYDNTYLIIVNNGDCTIKGLTLIWKDGSLLESLNNDKVIKREGNRIIIDFLAPRETLIFKKNFN